MAKKGGGNKPSTPQVQTNAGVNPMGPPAKSQPASVAAQVRASGAVLSKKEASAIAESTGKTVAQVMAKAQGKGTPLSSGLVNAFNNNKLGPNTYSPTFGSPGQNRGTTQALQQLQALQGLKMNKGTAYAGYSTTTTPSAMRYDGVGGGYSVPGSTTYNPIVLPRNAVGGAGGVARGAGAGSGRGGGAGAGGAGGAGGNKIPNNGEFDNIKALFEEQMAAARAEIDKYKNMQAEQINAMQLNFADQLAASQTAADQEISYLNDLMMQQQQQSQQTQSLLEQQNQAAQAAYAEQARAAAALGKAFVPALEPTAATVQLGDQRLTKRDEANNSLSSLAITSSLGSNSNPLAGLQLA